MHRRIPKHYLQAVPRALEITHTSSVPSICSTPLARPICWYRTRVAVSKANTIVSTERLSLYRSHRPREIKDETLHSWYYELHCTCGLSCLISSDSSLPAPPALSAAARRRLRASQTPPLRSINVRLLSMRGFQTPVQTFQPPAAIIRLVFHVPALVRMAHPAARRRSS